MDKLESWVQLLGVLGIGGVATAIITAISSRKKIGAETSQTIVLAAGDQVDNMREELAAARAETREAREARKVWEARQSGWWARGYELDRWIRRFLFEARRAGIEIEDPPPIFPPPGE